MSQIHFSEFSGIIPRTHKAKLQGSFAQVAHDIDLKRGTLRPIRNPLFVADVASTTKTIYQWGCCWLEFDKCVEVTDYSQECHRIYTTGDLPYPAFTAINSDCSIGCGGKDWTRVGVYRPNRPPTTVGGITTVTSRDGETTSYIYTFVNCYCEEGAPSPPTPDLYRNDGVTAITVSGFETPPPEYNITKINIYRLVSGHMFQKAQTQEHLSEFFFVGQIDLATGTFVDKVKNLDIGHAINTQYAGVPPSSLRGMMRVNGSNTLAGFTGNKMYFSDNNMPSRWNDYNEIALDDNILMIRPLGQNIAVMTTGNTYIVKGMGDCKSSTSCRDVQKSETPFPAIECCSHRSSIETPVGVVFVSSKGLCLMTEGNPNPHVITESWYTDDEWQQLRPETMRLGYDDGQLFCTSDVISFRLFLDSTTYKNDFMKNYLLTTISDKPQFYFLGQTGELFFLENSKIWRWGASNSLRKFTWVSKQFDTREYKSFSCMQADCDNTCEISLFTDKTMVYNRVVLDDKGYRIPFYGRKHRHAVKIEGKSEVWGLKLATSYWDLNNVGD